MALGPEFQSVHDRAVQFLLSVQNSNGSWPVFAGDGQEGSWVTSLACIALHDKIEAIPEQLKGFAWLMDSAGEESHWLWKWKFRTTDRHVRFDRGRSLAGCISFLLSGESLPNYCLGRVR